MSDKRVFAALDGTPLREDLFIGLFNGIDTYVELPRMIELAIYDVTRAEFDSIKEHSIVYHTSGMLDVIVEAVKALKTLQVEATILGINLEDELDFDQIPKLQHAVKCFSDLVR